jgi:dTDP-4-dehydrorhamnose 3,5-epimerase
MIVTETALPGVLLLQPKGFSDARGMFMETYNEHLFADLGLPTYFPQDNYSCSRRGVVRGLHYQIRQPQGKLVRVLEGAALDIAIDLRRSSPTCGRHVALELRAGDAKLLWIPPGFGHGFLALTEIVGFAYKVTDYYSAQGERTILWNDVALGIDWGIDESTAILSARDAVGTAFADAELFA